METETVLPSTAEIADFAEWLCHVCWDPRDDSNETLARYLVRQHDWSASRRVEVDGRFTMDGNPQFYTFS